MQGRASGPFHACGTIHWPDWRWASASCCGRHLAGQFTAADAGGSAALHGREIEPFLGGDEVRRAFHAQRIHDAELEQLLGAGGMGCALDGAGVFQCQSIVHAHHLPVPCRTDAPMLHAARQGPVKEQGERRLYGDSGTAMRAVTG